MTQQLDFGELRQMDLPGQALEGLVRQIGYRLYTDVEWTGVGTDDQKDLVLSRVENGRTVRWLVSCKNYPRGRVSERDLPRQIVERVLQHNCDGYLLVTTGGVTTGAKNLIDGIDGTDLNGRIIRTEIWDKAKLIEILTRTEMRGIVIAYFPQTAKALAAADVLDSVSLFGVLASVSARNQEATAQVAIALVEDSENAVIARSVVDYVLENVELSDEDFYELLYELARYGPQEFEEDGLTQKLSEFFYIESDSIGLDIALMNIDNYMVLSEAYVDSVTIRINKNRDLVFKADVSVSTEEHTSGKGVISGRIEEDGVEVDDVDLDSLSFYYTDEDLEDMAKEAWEKEDAAAESPKAKVKTKTKKAKSSRQTKKP